MDDITTPTIENITTTDTTASIASAGRTTCFVCQSTTKIINNVKVGFISHWLEHLLDVHEDYEKLHKCCLRPCVH